VTASRFLWSNFLFDLDGTLIDSSPLHDEAYRVVLERFRKDLLRDFSYDNLKALPTLDGFQSLGVLDLNERLALTEHKQRYFRSAVASNRLKALGGAQELLEDLRRRQCSLFIVSSGSRKSVIGALRGVGLESFFEDIITPDEVTHGKPAPDAFLLCMSRHRLAVDDTVVVEDALPGIKAARAAGLYVIGVHNQSVAAHADMYFPNLPRACEWLSLLKIKRAN
jgi:HAD superfamily hydrolase (TIGR01509 family)